MILAKCSICKELSVFVCSVGLTVGAGVGWRMGHSSKRLHEGERIPTSHSLQHPPGW